MCIDLTRDEVVQTILFPTDVALPTTYLNDVRFDLRRGEAGAAFITDSCDQGPNGIIVVDLATGQSWRRLHEHPSTKAQTPPDLRMIVEGEEFLERAPDGSTNPVTMGADGIAIAADGSRLYYCCLASRRWWSVAVDALLDRALDDDAVAATLVDEGDKGSGGDGMETDAAGRLYVTDGEHDAIHRRHPDGRWETVVHDPRLLWPDTMSVAADGHLYVTANQLYRGDKYRGGTDERRKPYVLFRTPGRLRTDRAERPMTTAPVRYGDDVEVDVEVEQDGETGHRRDHRAPHAGADLRAAQADGHRVAGPPRVRSPARD